MNFEPSDEEITAAQLVERQLAIEHAARRKFPWDPTECTLYLDIAPRQLLFACLTCQPHSAICYSCGLRCHADHDIVELETKRGFRCDCGTARIPGSRCTLRRTDEVDSAANTHLTYGQNFDGRFCVCHESSADPDYGDSAMIQCLVGTRCGEDWFHARCICGVSRAEERRRQADAEAVNGPEEAPPCPVGQAGSATAEQDDSGGAGDEDEDEDVDMESDGDNMATVFPELPASFGAMVCPECVRDVPQLRASAAAIKEVNGYLFLDTDYIKILGSDAAYKQLVVQFPFLGEPEESYLPQRDEDTATLLEAGERALQGAAPHETVVEGITAFNAMQTRLIAYLREIGSEDRAITKQDVEAFFSNLRR